MFKLALVLSLFVAFFVYADDEPEEVSDDSELPVITLKPDEKAKVIKRTVTVIKTTTNTESESPIAHSNTPSWRCKNIPDEAFVHLGTFSKGASKHAWENRAASFISTYGINCPSFAALEKEFPPHLNQKKYTEPLQAFFELNRSPKADALVRIAREDELERYKNHPGAKDEKYFRLLSRVNAARALLEVKFPEEMKHRYEAQRFLQKFGSDFLDRNGNPKSENFRSLKTALVNLNPEQKIALKGYLRDTLSHREYPKLGLIEKKQERGPASISKKEAGNRTVIHLLLFELE